MLPESSLSDSNRVHQVDKKINTDVYDKKLVNQLFVRLVVLDKTFTKVDFSYSIFDTCYLRKCKFDSCNFTGCRFIGTNLQGAEFFECDFRYVTFEKTIIENYILDKECPKEENLKMKFARSLRINYQSMGDSESANKAMSIELKATEEHLYKSWSNSSDYYRKNYRGRSRFNVFIEWIKFKLLDLVWGNGESLRKLLLTTIIIFFIMAWIDVFILKKPQIIASYIQSLLTAPQIFMGTLTPPNYPTSYLTVILFTRLIAFGSFMSIIIKRFSRR